MRFGETIYYCKKKDGVEEYDTPQKIILRFNYFSLMPNTSYRDIKIYGEEIKKRYTAYANYRIWGNTFKEGDRLYIDNLKPMENEENGKNANAIIDGVLYDNHFIKLNIRKLINGRWKK